MSTHAIETSEGPRREPPALVAVRYADIGLLAVALAVFLAAGLPLAGYAVGAAAWLAQRAIQYYTTRRAAASDDPRTVVGLMAGSMIGRAWLIAGSVFAVGVAVSSDDGLAAAVLCIACFTVYFTAQMLVRPFEPPRPRGKGEAAR